MPDSFDEAFPGGFEECVSRLGQEPDIDDPERLCGWLNEHGFEALSDTERTPEDVLLDLSVEYVSVVDEPAQDSEWLLAKSASAETGGTTWDPTADPFRTSDVLLKQDPAIPGAEVEEDSEADEDSPERKVWAAVLEPETVDKQGDLIPRPEIEQAAHMYLKHYRKVDEDHNLLDGSGVPVESYIIRDGPEEFETPAGEAKTYPAGTWIMGVELEKEAWERVQAGELSGFSIYGDGTSLDPSRLLTDSQARAVQSVRAFSSTLSKQIDPEEFLFEDEETAMLVARAFGMESVHEHTDGFMPGESMDSLRNLLEQVEGEGDDSADDENGENDLQNMDDKPEDYDEDEEEEDEDEQVDMAWKDEENPCWDGYVMVGTKIDDSGNEVPRCVPEEDVDEPVEQTHKNDSGQTQTSNMDANENADDRIDELLEKMEDTHSTVEDVQKSVSSVRERVEQLEEWRKSVEGVETGAETTEGDSPDSDLSTEEVEEIASDAATEGAEEAVKSLLDLDDLPEDDEQREEVVRKGVRTLGGPGETTASDGSIDVSTGGIMEDL